MMNNNGQAPSTRLRGFTISGDPAGVLGPHGPSSGQASFDRAAGVGMCSSACRGSAALTNEDNPPRYLMAML